MAATIHVRSRPPAGSRVRVSAAALVRDLAGGSFFEFVREFWSTIIPEPPVFNWHIRYMCDAWQEDAERVFARRKRLYDTALNIPPGTTKSTVLSIMAPAWAHARAPSCRFLTASHTQALTFEFSRKSLMIMRSELYRAAFPATVLAADSGAKSLYATTENGGRICATVGGMSPTGFHAHFITVDDPIDPRQARSRTAADLDTANAFMTEVIPGRKVDKEIAVTWLVMQRLHMNDPTGHLLERDAETGAKQWRHLCLPAVLSPHVKPVALRRRYVDGHLDPIRLGPVVCAEAERSLGRFGYAGQFGQHPIPRGGGLFTTEAIVLAIPPPPGDPGWRGICRFWDKAGTAGGGAFTAGVKIGRYRHRSAPADGSGDLYWILHVHRGQYDAGPRERVIMDHARTDGRGVRVGIEQEPGSGGKESAQLTAKRLAGYRVKIIPATGTKEDRAEAWATPLNLGAFRIAPGPWVPDFLDELRFFPYGKYKDQVDAGSGAFIVLTTTRAVGASN